MVKSSMYIRDNSFHNFYNKIKKNINEVKTNTIM